MLSHYRVLITLLGSPCPINKFIAETLPKNGPIFWESLCYKFVFCLKDRLHQDTSAYCWPKRAHISLQFRKDFGRFLYFGLSGILSDICYPHRPDSIELVLQAKDGSVQKHGVTLKTDGNS